MTENSFTASSQPTSPQADASQQSAPLPPPGAGAPAPFPPRAPVPLRSDTPGYRAMKEAILNEKGLMTTLFCLVFCVLLCDVVFWGGLGASVPGMLLLYEAFAFWLFRGRNSHRGARLLALPIGVISLGFLLHWNPGTQFISALTLAGLLAAQLVLFSGVPLRGIFTFDLFSKAFLNILFRPLEYLDFPFRCLGTLKDSKSPGTRAAAKVLLGLLLALPMAGILIFLFSCADAMFEYLADSAADALGLRVGHLILDVTAGCILALFASSVLLFNRGGALGGQKPRELSRRWDPTVCGTFLLLIDLVLIAFVAVQFTYFFGGRPLIAAGGLTYAEYARRGFFELAWATALVFAAAVLILTFCRAGANRQPPLLVRVCVLVLCLCNGVILVSAVRRMLLYVEVYGLSVKRLLTLWFMGLTALCLVWLVLRCFWSSFPAAAAAGCTVLAMVSLLSLCNTDRLIARCNADMFLQGSRDIDIPYLSSLSPSALPELIRLYGAMPEEDPALTEELGSAIRRQADRLEDRHRVYAFTLDRLLIEPVEERFEAYLPRAGE